MLKGIVVSLLLALMLSWSLDVKAQSAVTGMLTYTRSDDNTREIVNLTASGEQTYLLPESGCWLTSPNGIYALEASWSEDHLIIRDLATFNVLIQTDWSDDWDRCAFVWYNDSQFAIRQQGTSQEFFDFEISNDTLVPFIFEPSLPQYPELPRWLSTTENNFILPSPRPNIYLYERCESGQTTRSGSSCAGNIEFVIYDVEQQIDVHVLVNPSPSITGRGQPTGTITYANVEWSPDGRYLAFDHMRQLNFPFTLSVYDLDTSQYLDTHFVNAEIDSIKPVLWSPTEHKLAFWMLGSLTTDEFDPVTARNLVIFDAETSEFITADRAYELGDRGYVSAAWSPDASVFAFVDRNSNLILVDTDTGITTTLDEHVSSIIVWS